MELRIYLSELARRRWLILAITVICVLVGLLYALNQQEIYKGKASYVLRPHSSLFFDEGTVRAIDTLSRRIKIATTYAEVAGGDLNQKRTLERLDLPPDNSTGLSVTGSVIPGTNVLEMSIRGPDREAVGQFADAVSQELLAYVNSLYDVFELELLDEPWVARLSVGPNAKVIVAGAIVLGLALGSILALLVQYWQLVTAAVKRFDILDREEDILCRYEEKRFALLLPALSVGQARDLLGGVDKRFGAAAVDQVDEGYAELGISASIACFTGQSSAIEIIEQAEQALETASGPEGIQIALFEGDWKPVTAGV